MAEFRHIKGLDELKAKFAFVSREAGKTVLRKGASAGAQVIKRAVIPNIPVAPAPHRKGQQPGVLKRSILVKFIREQSNETQAMFVVTFRQGKRMTAKGRDAFYAKWVERGHRIVPRSRRIGTYRGKALNAKTLRARRADASGFVPGRFFFRDSIAASQRAAGDKIVLVMTEEMKKVIGS
jgi:HK97 gp10 family phage protein